MGTGARIFVTGATGFIGRFVIENLLRQGAQVTALVREATLTTKRQRIDLLDKIAGDHATSIKWVCGDLNSPNIGLSPEAQSLAIQATHIIHLAALYDLEADVSDLEKANTHGTSQLCDWLKKSQYKGRLHHVSSIAVAGNHKGTFTEEMFAEGQSFPHAYHRTKYESEKHVRESGLDHCIYRPGSVVGHSQTGFIEKSDGIYYAFDAINQLSKALPSWVKLPFPNIKGGLNIVPVDHVANALTHIALHESKPGQCYHLVDPEPPSLTRLTNILLKEKGGPQLNRLPWSPPLPVAAKTFSMMPIYEDIKSTLLNEAGFPAQQVMNALNLKVRFTSEATQHALQGTSLQCPSFKSYAKFLHRYYDDHFDPRLQRPALYSKMFKDKIILITGASRGIGKSAAMEAAKSGAHVIAVARSSEDLDKLVEGIQDDGGQATAYALDLTSKEEIDKLVNEVTTKFGGVDALIHNAARSIRRPIAESLERSHDFERTMRLNYFAPVQLTLGLLPGLLERQGSVVMVLTLGVLMPGPFFGAYLPTKAALDIFGDVLAAEYAHQSLHVGSVYLPLVKTAMMAPTKEYEKRVDLMTPEKAAHMILDSVAKRRRRVMLPIGRFFNLANKLAPGPTTQVLNLLRRTFPAATETSEFPMEQAIITQAIGGSPI